MQIHVRNSNNDLTPLATENFIRVPYHHHHFHYIKLHRIDIDIAEFSAINPVNKKTTTKTQVPVKGCDFSIRCIGGLKPTAARETPMDSIHRREAL